MNPGFQIHAQADGKVEVLIYDDIYSSGCSMFGGICADEIVSALLPYKDQNIVIRINSGGGDVWAGFTLYNFLSELPSVSTVIDGIAASAASIVALAGYPVVMPRTATLMIHNPSALVIGEASDMRKMADDLDRTRDSLADIYVEETGATREQVIQWMNAETWFNGEEALAAGFADNLTNSPAKAAGQDIGRHRYKHVPNRLRRKSKQSAAGGIEEPTHIMQNKVEEITACGCGGAAGKALQSAVSGKEDLAAIVKERDDLKNKLISLEAQLELNRARDAATLKARAESAVDAAIKKGQIAEPMREINIRAYQEDEVGFLKSLGAIPLPAPAPTGTEPLKVRNDIGVKSIRDQIGLEHDPKKRQALRSANWEQLRAA